MDPPDPRRRVVRDVGEGIALVDQVRALRRRTLR
jgi:hypothetical protein